jgi:SPX domain protein involved in polyphosphate accumulation
MKFGKRLLAISVIEWKRKYVDYKALKKTIKRIRVGNEDECYTSINVASSIIGDNDITTSSPIDMNNKHNNNEHMKKEEEERCVYLDEYNKTIEWAWKRFPLNASDFVSLVCSELEKVNEFFERTEKRYATRQAQIHQQIEMYRTLRAKKGKKGMSKKQLVRLREVIQEHYRALNLLLNYRILNFTAFAKIMKKYEKKMSYTEHPEVYAGSLNEFKHHLQQQYFYSSPILKALIVQVEYLFTEYLYHGDRKQAMENVSILFQII